MTNLEQINRESQGTTWVIGDVHGCFTALTTLVERVGISPGDTIITLGDYVDRGPQSRDVIEWLIERERTSRLIPLIGNHEIMMLKALEDSISQKAWESMYVGGHATLESYGSEGSPAKITQIPDEHWDFMIRRLRRYHENEKFIFAHASVDPFVELEAQTDIALLWSIFEPQALHQSGRPIICGHSEQRSGLPSMLAHGVCIDTGAFRPSGWLTCLNIETGEFGQANQKGEFRTDELPIAPSLLFQGPSGAKS
ncbi:MAG: serine/threonine protein phosphatase [Verrucomicrobiaceae bacterium]|nr:serine/threonine protein phosphatase [Verrucomicrobiaceae bacterium]